MNWAPPGCLQARDRTAGSSGEDCETVEARPVRWRERPIAEVKLVPNNRPRLLDFYARKPGETIKAHPDSLLELGL